MFARPNVESTGLAVRARAPDRILLEFSRFALHEGERVALLGPSGSGKTLFCLSLLGLLRVLHPQLHVVGGFTWHGGHGEPHVRVGYVPQGTAGHLHPSLPVGRQVRQLLIRSRAAESEKLEERAMEEVLRRLRLPPSRELWHRLPHELSGGMRQRLLLAVALLATPRLLVLDEPTTALDGITRAAVYATVREQLDRNQAGLVLVTHTLAEATILADRVYRLNNGVLEDGPQPSHSELFQIVHRQELVAGDTQRPTTAPGSPTSERALHAENIRVRLGPAQGLEVIRGFSGTISPGRALGVIGESGAGKTTLVRALARLVPLSLGRLLLGEHDLTHLSDRRLRSVRAVLQMTFQDASDGLNPHPRVRDLFDEPARIHGSEPPDERDVRACLDRLALDHSLLRRRAPEVSFGQRQRIAQGRTVVGFPELGVLLLDEPTTGLDPSSTERVVTFLDHYKARVGLLVATHDLAVIESLCDALVILWRGLVVESIPKRPWKLRHPYTQLLWRAAFVSDPDDLEEVAALIALLEPDPLPGMCPFEQLCRAREAPCSTWRAGEPDSHWAVCPALHLRRREGGATAQGPSSTPPDRNLLN